MTRAEVCGTALIVLTAAVRSGAAQDMRAIAFQQDAIVNVDGLDHGSGLVIAVEPGTVRIITARHVVEGATELTGAPSSKARPCANQAEVVFAFAPGTRHKSTGCMCSEEDDVAELEVAYEGGTAAITPFKEPRPLLDMPGNHVIFLARDGGLNTSSVVAWNDATATDRDTRPRITMIGPGALPGYSGGAVLDADGGLIGMILSANQTATTALRWSRIVRFLTELNVQTNLLEGSLTQKPNPHFRDSGPQNFLNEVVRNTIRQYRDALAAKNYEALVLVYPKLPKDTIRALFGDAARISLTLRDCSDLDRSRIPHALNCEYELTIFRRTGVEQAFRSRCFAGCGSDPRAKPAAERVTVGERVVFAVSEPVANRWVIDNIAEEKK